MSLTVPALMGVSATMCSMVGGFLLLRHTRINGQIEESRLREIFYRAEQNSIHQSSREYPVPFYQEAVAQLWRNNQRLLALAYMKDAEGDIVSRLSASRGNLRRAVVSWGAMLLSIVSVLKPPKKRGNRLNLWQERTMPDMGSRIPGSRPPKTPISFEEDQLRRPDATDQTFCGLLGA